MCPALQQEEVFSSPEREEWSIELLSPVNHFPNYVFQPQAGGLSYINLNGDSQDIAE